MLLATTMQSSRSHQQIGLSALFAGVPALLVLDSCEGVVNGVSGLCAELQVLATELCVLTTSWKLLAISDEKVIELEPMCVPDESVSPDAFIGSEAVRLFEQYAKLRKAKFSVTDKNRQPITNILKLTEGLPLAIRLIAARVADTPLDKIVQQLRDNPLPASPTIASSLPRHASLSRCVDWSFGLLSDDVKALFPLLSLFIAPFTYEQAIRLAQGAVHTPGTLSRGCAETRALRVGQCIFSRV
jgi:non-specific serine/threonine protein kinase